MKVHLLVDDGPLAARLAAALERVGLEVDERPGAIGSPAVVFCDEAHLPAVVERAPLTPRVVLFAAERFVAAEEALDGGAVDAVVIPVDDEECALLAGRCRAWLGQLDEARRIEEDLGLQRARIAEDEAALAREQAELPAVERLRAELSQAVSGELCAAVAGVPDLLDSAAAAIEDEGARAAVVDAAHAARQAARMSRDLHDVDRAARAPLVPLPRPFPLAALLDELLEATQRLAEDYESSFALGAVAADVECHTDRALLLRALQNLAESGLRRSRQGTVRLDVSVDATTVRFTLHDPGSLPPAVLPRLFDRRSRLEGGTVQRGASLAFCGAAATALGGSVHVEVAAEGGLVSVLAVRRDLLRAAS